MGHGLIALRPASPADADLLLGWRNDPATRRASFDEEEIDEDTHRSWLAARLVDARSAILIAHVDGQPAGQVRLDMDAERGAMVSIGLAPAMRGRGLAASVLRAVETVARERGITRLVAEVKLDNRASLATFRRAGYCEYTRTAEALVFERRL